MCSAIRGLDLGGVRADGVVGVRAGDEQQALDAYKDLLPRVVGHPVLEDFIRRQIEIETEHVHEIVDTVRAGGPLKLLEKSNDASSLAPLQSDRTVRRREPARSRSFDDGTRE